MTGTALLVIDMQNDCVLPGRALAFAGVEDTVPRIGRLLGVARAAGLHIIHTRREYRPGGEDVEKVQRKLFFERGGFLVAGTEGCEGVPELAARDGELVVVRPAWSAFQQTALLLLLTRLRVRRLVVAGTALPAAVRCTAFDALSLDLDVVVVRDGTSSGRDDVHEANLADLARAGAKIDTCLELIREAEAGLLARP
ncbi:MAG: isochorismatase family protein [Dehalococcoidia bacterium]|nr:isochorismatase family protein [Dehalococcoidia bacterium]